SFLSRYGVFTVVAERTTPHPLPAIRFANGRRGGLAARPPFYRQDDHSAESASQNHCAEVLSVVPATPAPEVAAFLAHVARQHHLVDLVGAVDEPRLAGIAIDPLEHRVLGIAARAVELDRRVGGVMQRVGDVHLGHRDFLLGAAALVDEPGRMHHQEPPDLDTVGDLAELDLHALAVGEPHPEPFAVGDISLGDLAAALGEPKPAHAVRETGGAEPDLGDAQAVAGRHQDVLVRNLEALEREFAVAAVLLRAHDRDAPHDLPAGLISVKQEGGEAATRIVGGARDEDEMIGDAGAGDEPLVTADDPAIALALGAGADHARIRAAAGRRLGHGEGRAHLALDDRPQPLLLLRRRADAR